MQTLPPTAVGRDRFLFSLSLSSLSSYYHHHNHRRLHHSPVGLVVILGRLKTISQCYLRRQVYYQSSSSLLYRYRHLHRHITTSLAEDRLVGLVVKVSTSRAEDPGFESHLRWDFSWSRQTSDLKIGTPVATLPGARRYRVSAGTGWPGVSIM